MRVVNEIFRTLDQGGGAILVLLDLSVAFATLYYSIRLSRMESVVGVKGFCSRVVQIIPAWPETGLKSNMNSPQIRRSCGLFHRDLCWVHHCSYYTSYLIRS